MLGDDVKKLGFGTMRLPRNGDRIDVEKTQKMVDMFMEAGFNYFDTAWAYDGSEEVLRKTLVERYPRESYKLATKTAAWINCQTKEDAYHQFDVSLQRSHAGYFDYYLLHNVGEMRTPIFNDFDMWDFIKEKKAQGFVKHIGFSFHSTPEELEELLIAHPESEFVQLQINYADWDNPAIKSRECYEIARKYGKEIIIMEPVKGGMLANPPDNVKEIFDRTDNQASYASWAIRFAASLDGVITVLSGMSTMEQMADNISYMKDFQGLTKDQQKVIKDAQIALKDGPIIPCTNCNYCAKVCPMNIGISRSFNAYNCLLLYADKNMAKHQINLQITNNHLKFPDQCIQCGACERACPQHIDIREQLKIVSRELL